MTDDEKDDAIVRTISPIGGAQALKTGTLAFITENGSGATYQEASGAPVEARSPLGTTVQYVSLANQHGASQALMKSK
jgi:hypothetical protein